MVEFCLITQKLNFDQFLELNGWFGPCSLSQDGLNALTQIQSLQFLSLAYCNIEGGHEKIAELQNLQFLDLSGQRISTDDLILLAFSLTNLQALYLERVRILRILCPEFLFLLQILSKFTGY